MIRKHNVLLLGESGVGKELCAEAIQEGVFWHGTQKLPKVKLNVTALSDTLLESELFGHVKGAFTGAASKREGKIMNANGGSIFFDEIGDLNPNLQVKLLRAIYQGKIQKVGSDSTEDVDVRYICATNKDIFNESNFRRDLLERIAGIVIYVPPLRERKEDIILIRDNYIKRNIDIFHLYHRERYKFAKQMKEHECEWPGNVRQLESAIKSSLLGLDITENINRTTKLEEK